MSGMAHTNLLILFIYLFIISNVNSWKNSRIFHKTTIKINLNRCPPAFVFSWTLSRLSAMMGEKSTKRACLQSYTVFLFKVSMSWCVQYTSEPLISCAEYLKWGLWCSYERCISLRGKWFTKLQSSLIPKFQCLVQLNLARIYFYFNLCKWNLQDGSYLNLPVPVSLGHPPMGCHDGVQCGRPNLTKQQCPKVEGDFQSPPSAPHSSPSGTAPSHEEQLPAALHPVKVPARELFGRPPSLCGFFADRRRGAWDEVAAMTAEQRKAKRRERVRSRRAAGLSAGLCRRLRAQHGGRRQERHVPRQPAATSSERAAGCGREGAPGCALYSGSPAVNTDGSSGAIDGICDMTADFHPCWGVNYLSLSRPGFTPTDRQAAHSDAGFA